MKKLSMLCVLFVLCVALPRSSTDIPKFLVGVNYAWKNYGFDFGGIPGVVKPRKSFGLETEAKEVFSDFQLLSCYLVDLVRVFVHCDLRAGAVWNPAGEFEKLDEQVAPDFEVLFQSAKANHMQVILSLLDFMVADGLEEWCGQGEHPGIITDARQRQKFMRAMYKELRQLRPYIAEIYAVETMNEPENVTAVSPEQLEQFLAELAEVIHRALPGVQVMSGSATRLGVDQFSKDTTMVSFHQYDKFTWTLDLPYDYPARLVHPNKPVLIAETEATLVQRKLETAYKNGYAGVCFWSYKLHNSHIPRLELNEIYLWKRKHRR